MTGRSLSEKSKRLPSHYYPIAWAYLLLCGALAALVGPEVGIHPVVAFSAAFGWQSFRELRLQKRRGFR